MRMSSPRLPVYACLQLQGKCSLLNLSISHLMPPEDDFAQWVTPRKSVERKILPFLKVLDPGALSVLEFRSAR